MRRALHALTLLALVADVTYAARAADIAIPLLAFAPLAVLLWVLAPAPRPWEHLAAAPVLLVGAIAAAAPWQVRNFGYAMLALAALLGGMLAATGAVLVAAARAHVGWARDAVIDDEMFAVAT